MCCKADKKLTKRYQKRKRRFSAWKVWNRGWECLMSTCHNSKPGGYIEGPGHITSNRTRKRYRKDKGELVFAGMHWFAFEADALVEAKQSIVDGYRVEVVRVMVDPKEVVAVGELWWNSGSGPYATCKGNVPRVGVSTAVELLPKDWKKATA